jgi:hypothetical protein
MSNISGIQSNDNNYIVNGNKYLTYNNRLAVYIDKDDALLHLQHLQKSQYRSSFNGIYFYILQNNSIQNIEKYIYSDKKLTHVVSPSPFESIRVKDPKTLIFYFKGNLLDYDTLQRYAGDNNKTIEYYYDRQNSDQDLLGGYNNELEKIFIANNLNGGKFDLPSNDLVRIVINKEYDDESIDLILDYIAKIMSLIDKIIKLKKEKNQKVEIDLIKQIIYIKLYLKEVDYDADKFIKNLFDLISPDLQKYIDSKY